MNLLIVKLSSLGDVIQTMPVVHDVLQQYPQAQIDWVVEEGFAPLLQRLSGLRRVIPIAQRRWRTSPRSAETKAQKKDFQAALQQQSYDAVLDFQGLIKSALVARQALLAPGGWRASYANRSEACGYEWPNRFFQHRLIPMERRIHAVARYRLLAARALGFEAAPWQGSQPVWGLQTPVLTAAGLGALGMAKRKSAVVLVHGTTRTDNEWPIAYWIALSQILLKDYEEVWLPQGNAHDLQVAQTIAHGIGAAAKILPKMALPELMDCMASSQGVVGVDSGLSHLAVALNLPHVQIFSQPRAWRAGPVGQAHQIALGGEHVPTVAEVAAAWHTVTQAMVLQSKTFGAVLA